MKSVKASASVFVFLLLTIPLGLSIHIPVSRAGTSPADSNAVFDPSAMDTQIDPCHDFYQYACGSWLRQTNLPADQTRWSRSFSTIHDRNNEILNSILESYAAGKTNSVNEKKLGNFYASCMDEEANEKQAQSAIATRLALIDKLTDRKQLAPLLAKLHIEGVRAFFGFGPSADQKQPTLQIAEFYQGGMSLPNSGYYLKTDPKSENIRAEFRQHLARTLNLIGFSPDRAKLSAEQIYAIELALAQRALPPEKRQDPTKLYHPTDMKGIGSQTPSLNWSAYFKRLGIQTPTIINVTESDFMIELDSILKNTDLEAVRSYLKYQVINSLNPYLGKKLYDEAFSFYAATLRGQKSQSPLWKRCVGVVSDAMGEALGQAFVEKTFSASAKKRVINLIDRLRQAFAKDFKDLAWLDLETRKQALKKLKLMTRKVGYPESWLNYGELTIRRESLWQNAIAANAFENKRQLRKIGGKTDPDEWYMSPQTVNAYYDPSVNQIVFPAGILQPPFFSNEANDAANYGAIGMVIGHEMTHGFDTTGSQFDGDGKQRNWWTASVKEVFQKKAQCLIDQYGQYEALPGLNVNGELTITENIADQGGLKLALAAYRLARQGMPEEAPIAGLNAQQQFFVSMAQQWCAKYTDEALAAQVTGDPHSPSRLRVIGSIVNNPDFQSSFQCPTGSPMAPLNRCSIW